MSSYGYTLRTPDGDTHTVGAGDVLWSADGRIATVVKVTTDGVVINAGIREVITSGWAPALVCGYCDRHATRIERDSGCPDLLCAPCARSQFSDVAEWTAPLTTAKRRQEYRAAYC